MTLSREKSSPEPADAQKGFQQVLIEDFSKCKIKNPAYSLRAFAKKIGISPAAVSEIMSGKRRISSKLATRVLEKLNTSPDQAQRLTNALQKRTPSSKEKRPSAAQRATTILSNDRFRIVTEWYHFGILSLMETQGFQMDINLISSRLGVPKREVNAALERLERVNMLRRNPEGVLVLTGETFHSSDGIPSNAVRASHASSLDLAKSSLEQDDLALRDITTLTIAINPANLPEARKIIRKFRTDLAAALETDPKSEVYMLNVNLFPLTKVVKK